jgi:hypothetical protein
MAKIYLNGMKSNIFFWLQKPLPTLLVELPALFLPAIWLPNLVTPLYSLFISWQQTLHGWGAAA